MQEYKM